MAKVKKKKEDKKARVVRLSYLYNLHVHKGAPTFTKLYRLWYGGDDFVVYRCLYRGNERNVVVYKTCNKCYHVLFTSMTQGQMNHIEAENFRTIYESVEFLESLARVYNK